jgi:hypothetical protein
MAITRIWNSGAESGSADELDSYNGGTSVISGTKKTGTYAFQVQYAGGTLGQAQISIPDLRQISGGWFLYIETPSTNNTWPEIIRVRSTTTEVIELQVHSTNRSLRLVVNGTQRDITTDFIIEWDTFYHFGIDVKVDPSSGWAFGYLDGSEVLSFSGNTMDVDINNTIFGTPSSTGGLSNPWVFDDIYFDNTTGEGSATAPRIKRFYSLTPNGDGNYTQWNPIPTGSHYQKVDERPPNDDTDYLEAVTGSLYDSFDMSTFTLDNNEDIIAMIPFVFAKRGSSTEQIALGTRSSGTDSVGIDQDLSTNYDYLWERQTTGSLGSPWNQSYMDSVEVVIKSAGTY